jgi:hypothetical protein
MDVVTPNQKYDPVVLAKGYEFIDSDCLILKNDKKILDLINNGEY